MIKLVEVTENNWMDIAHLTVHDYQKRYLDSPIGIIARGYAYRSNRSNVLGIENDGIIVGVALVKDLDDEPACYDLQQFLIDRDHQGKEYGTEALRQIIELLSKERKYSCVEVCVNKEDASALKVYEKIGFADTGYIDEDAPDCINLMYKF